MCALGTLAAALVLLLGAGAAQAQTSKKLVSNTGQGASTFGQSGDSSYSQAFTTGDHGGGYTLTSVNVQMNQNGSTAPTYTVSILSSSGSILGTLTNPASLPGTKQNVQFTAPKGGIGLAAEMTYRVRIDISANVNALSVQRTFSNNEDAGSEEGWSIANGGEPVLATPTSLMIAVHGYAAEGVYFRSASVSGATLKLAFTEPLDGASVPAKGNFSVSLDGVAQAPLGVSVAGNTATLTLARAAAHGQTVRVTYTKPGSNPLRNAVGHEVAGFTAQEVDNVTGAIASVAFTNTPVAGRPIGIGGVIEVTVTFHEAARVTGAPRIALSPPFGSRGERRYASYDGGSGTTALVFRYTVAEGDNSIGGRISVAEDALELNEGSIRLGTANAVLDHDAVQSANDVIGYRGRISQVYVHESPGVDADLDGTAETFTAVDGNREIGVWVSFLGLGELQVDTKGANGNVQVVVDIGGQGFDLDYQATFSNAIRFGTHTVAATHVDTDGVSVKRDGSGNVIRLSNGATIRAGESSGGNAPRLTAGADPGVGVLDYDPTPLILVRGANAAPTGADFTRNGNSELAFAKADFGYADADGDPQKALRIETLPVAAKGALKLDGAVIASADLPKTVTPAELDSGGLAFEPAAGFISGDTSFTFRVVDSFDAASAAANTVTLSVTAEDQTPPSLVGAAVYGATLTLTWGEALDEASEPAASAFTVTVDGSEVSLAATGAVAVNGRAVNLTLAQAVTAGESVTVSYTKPDSAPIQDLAGNAAARLPERSVTNGTATTHAVTASAGEDREVLTGAAVTLSGSGSSTRAYPAYSYAWTQTAGVTVALDDAASAAPSFTAPAVRTDLVFELVVNDGTADSAADEVTVAVRPGPNPSSAPCVHPKPADASFASGTQPYDSVAVADSSVSFSGAGSGQFSFWFCSPDGVRAELAQNVGATHVVTQTGLQRSTTYWAAVKRTCATCPAGGSWFAWRAFTTTNVVPRPTRAAVSETSLTIAFDKTLSTAIAHRPATSAFTVTVNNAARGVTVVNISGVGVFTGVRLGLASAVSYGDTVTVAYNGTKLRGANGSTVATFSDVKVQTPPSVTAATVDGTALTLTFNGTLDTGSKPAAGAFTVSAAGNARTVSGVALDGMTATLTLDTAVTHGQTVTATYTRPAANPLQDTAGNEVSSFIGQSVTNSTPMGGAVRRVAFVSSPVSGDTYLIGETIAAEVTWSIPVTVAGEGADGENVALRLDLGADDGDRSNSRRAMRYVSSTGSDTLRFEYAVKPGDMDADGVWVQTASGSDDTVVFLANGATLRNGTTDVVRTRAGLPTTGDAGRKVDGTSTATANAGVDLTVETGSSVTLDGKASTSTRSNPTYTYAWTQTGGVTVTLSGADTATPSFTAPTVRRDLEFSLVVNDGAHYSVPDTVTVLVRPPPNPTSAPCVHPKPEGEQFHAHVAGVTISGRTDSSISFQGHHATRRFDLWFCWTNGEAQKRATSVEGSHIETVPGLRSGTRYWVAARQHSSGGFAVQWSRWVAETTTGAPSVQVVRFTSSPASGDTYLNGETIAAEVTWSKPVTVANGGSNANVTLRLDLGADDGDRSNSRRAMRYVAGTGTDTLRFEYAVKPGDTDADGVWVQTASGGDDTVVFLANGATLRNGATDVGRTRAGLPTTGDAGRKVEAETSTATADAGEDRTVETGSSVTLDGKASTSTRLNPTYTYAWTQTGGVTVTLSGADTATPTFTAPTVRRDLEFSLVVNDGAHYSVPDTVTVLVRPPPNPTSAPCVHPKPEGEQFHAHVAGVTISGRTDSSISFQGHHATRRFDLWFCWTNGEAQKRATSVEGSHIETVPGLRSGTRYWVAARQHSSGGFAVQWSRWVAETTTGAPSVQVVRFTSSPASGDTYLNGETIAAEVTWSKPVTVANGGSNANVTLRLDLGADDGDRSNSRRAMRYVAGTGTDTLRFEYAVKPGDTDADGVWVQTASGGDDTVVFLANGATLRNGATDVGRTRAGLPTTGGAGRKVDGTSTATADAGDDLTAETGAMVTLDGTGSTSTRLNPTYTYAWTQTGGPDVTLSGADTATPTFTAPTVRTELEFSLVVNDGMHNSAPDTVAVAVRTPINATSVPCVQPTVAGGQLTAVALFEVTATTDSSITYRSGRPESQSDIDTLWFCWTNGEVQKRAENVDGTHSETVSDLDSGTTYWVTATRDEVNNKWWNAWRAVTTAGGASVRRAAFTTSPASGDTYLPGETVAAEVVFSMPVTVAGAGADGRNVVLRLDLGPDDADRSNSRREMRYVGGTGTDTLRFEYAVKAGDGDPDGVWLQTGSETDLTVVFFNSGGASIRSGAENVSRTRRWLPTTGDGGRKVDGAPPSFESAAAKGTTLTVTFDEALDDGSVPAAAAFTVMRTPRGGSATRSRLTGTPAIAGAKVTLNLARAAAPGDALTVGYTAPDGDMLRDMAGNEAGDFAGKRAMNLTGDPGDATAPTLLQGTVRRDKVKLTFDEPLDEGVKPAASQLGLTPSLGAVSEVAVSGRQITFTTATAATASQSVSLAIADTSGIQDLNGNRLAPVDGFALVNTLGTAPGKPGLAQTDTTMDGAPAVDGAALTLTFDQVLHAGQVPPADEFAVTVASAARGVVDVEVAGSTVVLTLASPAASGETVTVRYKGSKAPRIQNPWGQVVDAFSGQGVANGTSNRAPAFSSPAGTVNAVPGRQVSLPAAASDADGDAVTFSLSASPPDSHVPGTFIYQYTIERVFFTAKDDCDLENLDPRPANPLDTVVTVTASDPHGASSELELTYRTNWVCDKPGVTAVAVNGKAIALTFDEPLAPLGAAGLRALRQAFLVQGAHYRGAPVRDQSPSTIAMSGATVTLTLGSGVLPNRETTVEYVAAAARGAGLRDADGNAVPDFVRGVTSMTVGTVAPLLEQAQVKGPKLQALELTFDAALDASSAPAGSRFQVWASTRDTPRSRLISGTGTARVDGTKVLVTLAKPVPQAASVRIDYHKGGEPKPLRAAGRGAEVADIDGFRGAVLDGTRPELVGAAATAQAVTLYYSETLDRGSTPAPGDFAVTAGGGARTVREVSVHDDAVTLALASAVAAGEAVTVTWTPGVEPIRDPAGNDARGFSDHSANNWVGGNTEPLMLVTAEVDWKVVTLTYNHPLDPASVPGPGAFSFDFEWRSVEDVAVRGKTVVLTVNERWHPCDGNTVMGYAKPAKNALRNLWGTEVDAIPARGQAVTNVLAGNCLNDTMTATLGSIVLTASRPFAQDAPPRKEWFTVAASGGPVTVTGAAFSPDDPHQLVLSLSREPAEDETVTVSYRRPRGEAGLWNVDGRQLADVVDVPVTRKTAAAPSVEAVALVSDPGADATYAAGETVRVRVTFGGEVTVDTEGGTPRLRLDLDPADGGERWAAYESGSGEAALVFGYAASAGDASAGGVAVVGNTLELNGGAIGAAATGAHAALAHEGLDPDPAHKVDGVRPEFDRASVNGAALTVTFDEALDAGSALAGSAFTVTAAPAGGEARAIAGTGAASVEGAAVTVTLAGPVLVGEAVTVAYTPPSGAEARPLRDAAGNEAAAFAGETVTNGTAAPPSVVSAGVVSEPGADGAYTRGETVEAAVTFDRAVAVDAEGGTPALALVADGTIRRAGFVSGSGTERLVFAYRAVETDGTLRAVRVAASGLKLNGGSIADAADGTPAQLGFGEAPGVTAVSIADEPDGRWEAGDTVEAEVRFAEPVAVEGAPWVTFVMGSTVMRGAYAGGSGSDALTFRYTLGDDDGTWTRAVLVSNTLDAGDGSIRSAGGGLAAALGHVQGQRTLEPPPAPPPSVSGVAVVSDAGGDATYALGDVIRIRLTFSEAVSVDTAGGAPRLKIKMDPTWGEFWAAYESGGGSAALTFVHKVAEPNTSPRGIAVLADTLAANGATIRSAATGADAALEHAGLGHDPAHKVDWRLSPPVAAPPLTASFVGMPDEHDGKSLFTFELRFSEDFPGRLRYTLLRDEAFEVTNGRVRKAKRVAQGQNRRWTISVRPDSHEDVTVMLPAATDCAAPGAVCTQAGRKLSNTVSATVRGPALLSVADARAREGIDPAVVFPVTLSRAASGVVTVEYLTRDGTAKAGEDYERTRGTLTFEVGETGKTVSVPILDDGHDEGEETFTLKLRNAQGAWIVDGEATGTIENSDPIPKAWLARFGRTVTGHVLDAVEARLTAPRAAGAEAALAGQALPSWTPGSGSGVGPGAANDNGSAAGAAPDWATQADSGERDVADAMRRWMAFAGADDRNAGSLSGVGGGPGFGAGASGDGSGPDFESRAVTQRDLLTGTSFALTAQSGGPGGSFASLWGRGAISSFDGREGNLTLDGEVTTGLIGADWSSARDGAGSWTAGLAIGHSTGTGGYRRGNCTEGNCGGDIEAVLTGLYPYAGVDLTDRLSVWASAGHGAGDVTVRPDGVAPFTADLSMSMGAAGLRSEVLKPENANGLSLALKGDGRFTRTSSDAATNADGGKLAAAEADVWLLRTGIEGSRRFALGDGGDGASVTPSFEVGVRLDGGDAETGFGADLGGGVAIADPANGLSLDLKARALVAHEASGFREWGASASFAWDPRPETDRGLSLSLTRTLGAAPSGGMDALLSRETLADLAANDDGQGGGFEASGRLEGEIGYGLPVFGGGFTGTPNLGFGLSDNGAREYRLGWRLTSAVPGDPGFEVSLDATRSEPANGNGAGAPAEHGVTLRAAIRW